MTPLLMAPCLPAWLQDFEDVKKKLAPQGFQGECRHSQ